MGVFVSSCYGNLSVYLKVGHTKDRKGLLPPKRTEKNSRAPKRTLIWHVML